MRGDRAAKEAFVSGLAGTSAWEVSVITAVPAVLLLLAWLLGSGGPTPAAASFARRRPGGAAARRAPPLQLPLEYALLVLPQVAQLMGAVRPAALLAAASAAAAALWAARRRAARGRAAPLLAAPGAPGALLAAGFTAYRGLLMLVTCVAILAVDFRAFPRRLAKAETYGTGLMDAGVGAVVACSAFLRGLRGDGGGAPRRPGAARREAGRVAALAALGLGKAAFAAAADYQTHVGEYGRHWNFFLTLAALRAGAAPFRRARPAVAAAAGAALLAAHQHALSARGLAAVVHAERRGPGLLAANKEGLLSLPGYLALHLLGVGVGAAMRGAAARGAGARRARAAAPPAAALLAGLWAAYWAADRWVEPASRRACNAAYVAWALALGAQLVAAASAAAAAAAAAGVPAARDAALEPPRLLAAVGGHMLPVFLAANVLTGAVNAGLDTLAAGDWAARAVVAAYMAAVCGVAAALAHTQRARLKRS